MDFKCLVKMCVLKSIPLISALKVEKSPPPLFEPPLQAECKCGICGALFATPTILSKHMAGKHGKKNPLRCKVGGSQCLYCGKGFMTRFRIVTHLAYNSPKCKNYYIKCVPDNVDGITEELDNLESEQTSALRKKGYRGGFHSVPSIVHSFAKPFNPGIDDQ